MINLDDLQVNMEQGYNKLSTSVYGYRTQAMIVKGLERDIENSKLVLYRNGVVEGKNQAERDAHIAELLKDDINEFEDAKQVEADLFMKMELNKLAVEHLRAVLRIAELSQVEK